MHKGLTTVTGGYASTGLYTASVALNTTLPYVFDVWHNNLTEQFVTGTAITILDPIEDEVHFDLKQYVLNIKNLKQSYSTKETARFSLFVRDKDWSPTIYTVATNDAEGVSIQDSYFKIHRIVDNYEVIAYGTGSMNHTRLSFDDKFNYFDLPINLFEKNYTYAIKFVFKENGYFYEQAEQFKFFVED